MSVLIHCNPLVGSNPTPEIHALAGKNVFVHGYVSDTELDRLYSKIKITVIPLRFGAGIKGKVLEAIQNNIPVIGTSIAAEGIPNDDGIITVCDTATDFANAICDLYSDNARLQAISNKSAKWLRTHYSDSAALNKFKQWMNFK